MNLLWTLPALSDLESIRDYIKRDSAQWAAVFVEKIILAVEKLVDFPQMGRIVPEADDETIRELIFHSYRIIYHVDHERILILAVIHGARDLGTLESLPWEII